MRTMLLAAHNLIAAYSQTSFIEQTEHRELDALQIRGRVWIGRFGFS